MTILSGKARTVVDFNDDGYPVVAGASK